MSDRFPSFRPWPRRLLPALLPLALAACAAGTGYRAPEAAVPAQWQALPAAPAAGAAPLATAASAATRDRDAAVLAAWWRQFNDPVLDGLVDEALARNLDLRNARAVLQEARAARRAAGAELGPSVTASASYARNTSARTTGSGATRELYSAGFDASWEPDVFGRLRNGRAAADAELGAASEQLRDTRVSLVAEVARNYIELRAAQQRLALAEAGIAARRQSLELASWRQQAGLVSDLDVAQARTELESARAGLPALESAIVAARNRLDVLLGHAPGALAARLPAAAAVPQAATIAVGIPADTLRQRPDVRVAERRLAAQVARLDAARAARYPSLRLSGSIGWEALTAQGLGDAGALARSLLASLSAPIFDAGRLRAAVGVQDARLEQARVAYESAVLLALEDVEDALAGLAAAQEKVTRLADAVAAAQDTRAIAGYRYQSGLADFIAVLDSERTLISLQDQQAVAAGDLAAAQVRLYKALGGGWDGAAASGNATAAATRTTAAALSPEEPK